MLFTCFSSLFALLGGIILLTKIDEKKKIFLSAYLLGVSTGIFLAGIITNLLG
jgi:hypothetical protein